MARKMNLSTLEQKIEKAQQDVVKTKNAYNAATARLKGEFYFRYKNLWK